MCVCVFFFGGGGGGGGGYISEYKAISKTSSLKLLISYNIICHMYINYVGNYYVCTYILYNNVGANRSA